MNESDSNSIHNNSICNNSNNNSQNIHDKEKIKKVPSVWEKVLEKYRYYHVMNNVTNRYILTQKFENHFPQIGVQRTVTATVSAEGIRQVFYSILSYSILSYFVLFCPILFSSILFCPILFSSILFCPILFSSFLFYSILFSFTLFCSHLLF